MEKGLKMIPSGKHANGTANQTTSSICKVCGKEGRPKDIRGHIEANHLEGISIPCDYCDKICPSRNSLVMHKSRFHKWIIHFEADFWGWTLVGILKLEFVRDFETEVWSRLWSWSFLYILRPNSDQLVMWSVTLVFGESTQPLGLLCLWQCLFLMFQDF